MVDLLCFVLIVVILAWVRTTPPKRTFEHTRPDGPNPFTPVSRLWRCWSCRTVSEAQVSPAQIARCEAQDYLCRGCGARNTVHWSKR